MSEKVENFIDLNDEQYEQKEFNIFNNGKAGLAVGDFKIIKKDENDTSNCPDYLLEVYQDDDTSINRGFYYPDKNSENYEKRTKGLGKELRYLYHTFYGEDKKIPTFSSFEEALDKIMAAIGKKAGSEKVRIGVTYGTVQRPNAYLQIKQWTPYIELASVPEEKTSIKFQEGTDLMERLEPDSETTEKGELSDFTGETIDADTPENEDPFDLDE